MGLLLGVLSASISSSATCAGYPLFYKNAVAGRVGVSEEETTLMFFSSFSFLQACAATIITNMLRKRRGLFINGSFLNVKLLKCTKYNYIAVFQNR